MVNLFKQSCGTYGTAKRCLIYCLKSAVRKLQSNSKCAPPPPPPPTHKSRPTGHPATATRPHPPTRPPSQGAIRPRPSGHPATRPSGLPAIRSPGHGHGHSHFPHRPGHGHPATDTRPRPRPRPCTKNLSSQKDQFGQTQKHHVDSLTTLAQTVFANKRM